MSQRPTGNARRRYGAVPAAPLKSRRCRSTFSMMKRTFLLFWAIVAVAVCWRLDPVDRPLTGDNQLYFYLAERAASGVPPHVSHVDTKNQLGTLITATAIASGRGAGVDDVLASRVASIAFAAVSVVLAAELATLLAGSVAAGHVAAVALLAARGVAEHAATGNNVKIFLVVFVLLAHVAMARGANRRPAWDVLAGAAAGAAFLCWQPALLVLGAIVLEALLERGGVRRALTLLGAAMLPVVAYEAYFAMHGALAEQIRQAYVMTLGSVHAPARLPNSLAFVLTEARGLSSPIRIGPLSFALLAVAFLVRAARTRGRALALLTSRAGLLSFWIGGAAATAFTLYDHQGVPDLFFPDAYFAVAAGVLAALVARAAGHSGRMESRYATALVAGVFGVALVWQIQRDAALRRIPHFSLADQRRAAALVSGYHASSASVWAYGAVHLLGLAHLDNHVPYGLFFDDVESVLRADTYLPLKDGRMPEWILQSRRPLPGAAAYLAQGYDEVTTEVFEAQAVTVWQRRPTAF
ncbi:MAG: glycosyltransferase family 39 protein [Candidatus Binatia bacterium]